MEGEAGVPSGTVNSGTVMDVVASEFNSGLSSVSSASIIANKVTTFGLYSLLNDDLPLPIDSLDKNLGHSVRAMKLRAAYQSPGT